MLTLKLRRATLYLAMFLSVAAAHAQNVDNALVSFNANPTAEHANVFFEALLSEQFLDEPIKLSADADNKVLSSSVWYWAAEWYYDRQDYGQAEGYALKALPLCHATGDKTMEADCASLLGLIYVRLGNFSAAATYAKQCNELDLESGDASNIASSYNTLAGIYMSMRQPDEAERYILKAVEYVEKTDNLPRKAVIYGMASEVYQHKNEPEKTLYYATCAWEIEKQLGRPMHAAIRQTQRAAALTTLERYDESEQCLKEAIAVLEQTDNRHSLGIAYNHLGDLYYVTGRNREGADAYYKALDIFVEQHDIYNESHTRKGLRETLRGINPEEALLHGDRFEHLRDTIYDHETNQNLSQYAVQYDNQNLKQQQAKDKKRYISTTAIICISFLILAAILSILYHRQQKRHRKHLGELLEQIEQLRKQSAARKKLDEVKSNTSDNEDDLPSENITDDEQMLARVVELVSAELESVNFSVEHIATKMNMSASTFRRRIISATGDSPKTFILAIQMEKAEELLRVSPPMPLLDIAIKCGFAEAGSFARAFRRFYGLTPTQFREQQK